jgi:hypothetical protein
MLSVASLGTRNRRMYQSSSPQDAGDLSTRGLRMQAIRRPPVPARFETNVLSRGDSNANRPPDQWRYAQWVSYN